MGELVQSGKWEGSESLKTWSLVGKTTQDLWNREYFKNFDIKNKFWNFKIFQNWIFFTYTNLPRCVTEEVYELLKIQVAESHRSQVWIPLEE